MGKNETPKSQTDKILSSFEKKSWEDSIGESLIRLRSCKGIVHQITNAVTIHDCANVALAIGASPIMASHPEEVAEVTALSKALVLNIGTVEVGTEASMLIAGKSARQQGIPIVFDPVGAGATKLRRRLATELPQTLPISVIRCNAGEIMAIYNTSYINGGVDAEPNEALPIIEAAQAVAQKYQTVVAVTGEVDYVTDGERVVSLHNGVDLLPCLTGTGCMTSALVGCFLTTNDPFVSAIAGISYMSIAGELAKRRMKAEDGLGTFSMYLHDAMSCLTPSAFASLARIREAVSCN